jgi:hypothetical protein
MLGVSHASTWLDASLQQVIVFLCVAHNCCVLVNPPSSLSVLYCILLNMFAGVLYFAEYVRWCTMQMVAVFLPPELAREVLRQADLSSSSATAAAREDNLPNSPKHLQLQQRIGSPKAAAMAAGVGSNAADASADGLAGQQSSPFAGTDANQSFVSPAATQQQQQQQQRLDGGIADSALDMSARSRSAGGAVPGDLRSVSDTGRPAAAAAGQQQQQLRPGGTAGRDRSRPVLSSMSVQLTSRCGSRA